MSYAVQFQTDSKNKSIKYGGNTVYNSACGPFSLRNALTAAGIANVDGLTMCKLAVNCGARVDGGTDMAALLKAAAKKYNFTYTTTSKNAELLAHLQRGGVAILHAGNSYKLFSNSGHFVAAVAVSGQTVTVLDSYWYSSKYTASAIRRNFVSVVSNGVVRTSLTQCGKATADRSPSYYLISRKIVTTEEDTDDMTYYKKMNDIPSYYQSAVKKLADMGAISGTGDGELNVSEDICRMATILDRTGIFDLIGNTVYQTLDDVPKSYQSAVQKLIDKGAIAGTGDGELNISEDICRALTIVDRAGLLD